MTKTKKPPSLQRVFKHSGNIYIDYWHPVGYRLTMKLSIKEAIKLCGTIMATAFGNLICWSITECGNEVEEFADEPNSHD
ncbi:hypothetical protein [Myxococcus phage Mx1]|nr:hypothetical protein [Myxococcus phage Mx1]